MCQLYSGVVRVEEGWCEVLGVWATSITNTHSGPSGPSKVARSRPGALLEGWPQMCWKQIFKTGVHKLYVTFQPQAPRTRSQATTSEHQV